MKKIFVLFLLTPFLLISQIKGKVIKIKDGDTIVVLDNNNMQHTIRVADIDCPEKRQAFGKKAKWFVSDEIFGKIVFIKIKGIDRYKRTIGYVLYKNKNLSEELLKNGLAWHYKKYSKSKKLQDLENYAKKNKRGLWLDKNPIAPWNYRYLKYK